MRTPSLAVALGVALTLLDHCRRPSDLTDLRFRVAEVESELLDLRARVGEFYLRPEEMERR